VFWSPTFCGVCTGESRDNKDILAKGNYFWSTSKTGSHNIVFGVDVFKDYRFSNNRQSGSDFIVSVPRSIQDGTDFYPVFTNTTAASQTIISYRPILVPTKGTNIWTYSGFFNDSWRLNNNLSFNLGLRWDRNRSIDSSGAEVAKDAAFSPRLSMTWDPKGDGKTTVFASYARYVAGMANSIADASSAGGQPALYQWYYQGTTVNTASSGPYLTPNKALPTLFAWWDAEGGVSNPNLVAVTIPGLTDLRHFQKSTTDGRRTYGRGVCVVTRRSIFLDEAAAARHAGRSAGGIATPHAWNTLPTVPLVSLRTTYA
jgi:hypothetical protein